MGEQADRLGADAYKAPLESAETPFRASPDLPGLFYPGKGKEVFFRIQKLVQEPFSASVTQECLTLQSKPG